MDAVRRALDEGAPEPEAKDSALECQLAAVAAGLGLYLSQLHGLLQEVWSEVRGSPDLVRALAKAKLDGRKRYRGLVPGDWTDVLSCPKCGPVFIWEGAGAITDAVGCPWCHVRYRQGAVPAAAIAEEAEPSMPAAAP